MSGVVKCSNCRKIMTNKQFALHECEPPCKTSKRIPVAYWIDVSVDGKKQMLGVGLDGTHYYFIVEKPKAIPFIKGIFPSDESLQGDKSNGDLTEPELEGRVSGHLNREDADSH